MDRLARARHGLADTARAVYDTVSGLDHAHVRSSAGAWLLTLVACLFSSPFQPSGTAVLWPVAGVAVGLMAIATGTTRRAVACGIALGLLVASVIERRAAIPALVTLMATLAEAGIAAALLRGNGRGPFTLERRSDIATFAAVALGVPALVGLPAMLAFLLVEGSGSPGAEQSWASLWWGWTGSHVLGILTVAPAVIGFAQWAQSKIDQPQTAAAFVALGLGLIVVGGSLLPGAGLAAFLLLLLCPIVGWALLRASSGNMAEALLAIAAVIMRQATNETGFAADAPLAIQLLSGASAIVLLLLAAGRHPQGLPASPDAASAHRQNDIRAAVVIAPILLFACAGWWEFRDVETEAMAKGERKLNALVEHAHRVIEVQEAMLEAALARVSGRKVDEIAADPRLAAFLDQLVASTDTSKALFLVRLDTGQVQASSQVFPTPRLDHSQREYMRIHRQQTLRTVIGEIGQSLPHVAFGFTISRLDSGSGLVAVSHLPLEQFQRFYGQMREGDRDVINLLRDDGALLARQGRQVTTPGMRLPPQAVSMRLIRGELSSPVVSRGVIDGVTRQFHARKVASYPAYLVYGLDYAQVLGNWLRQLLPIGLLALLTSAMLHRLTHRLQQTAAEAEAARLAASTQRSLAEMNDRLSFAMRAAGAGAWELELGADRGKWSPECYELFGVDASDGVPTVSQWRARIVHPDDLARVQREAQAIMDGHTTAIVYDFRIVHPKHGVRWLATHGQLMQPEGKPPRIVGLSIDISERKRAEERLRESEARFRSLVGLMPAAMLTCDTDGRITYFNDQAATIWGRSPSPDDKAERFCGSHRLFAVDGAVMPHDACPMAETLRTGHGCRNLEIVMERPDGGRAPVLVNIDPILGRGGRLLGAVNIFLDITERKRTEAALRESEERLRLSIEAADIGTFSMNLLAGKVRYSPELAAMLGFPGVVEATLDDAFARVHRDDRPRVRAEIDACTSPTGDGRLKTELRFVRPGGSVGWMTWNGRVTFADLPEGRTAVRVLGACSDITERKQAEERLSASEARFRALVALSSDWYWEQDEHFRFVDISDPVQDLAGSTVGSHLGKTRWELPAVGVSEAQWAAHRAQLERHEPFRNLEYRRTNDRGEVIWMAVNGDPVFDAAGRFKGYRGTGHNITVRREAEVALRTSEARMRLAARAAGIGFWELDLASGQVRGSAEYFALYGLDATTEPVPVERIWERYHPDDRAQLMAESDDTGRPLAHDRRILLPDGQVRWVHVARDVLRDAAGKPVMRHGATIDITQRKQAEQVLAEARAELERRVADRTTQLEREMHQREEAQARLAQVQRLDAVGRLAGGLAHDFNNALAVIAANIELAEPHIRDAKARRGVQMALDVVEMSASLNRRLLTFTRSGSLKAERVRVDDHVRSIAGLLERTLGGNAVVTTDLSPETWSARLDPSELTSAILNLAINARDAMPGGGVLVLRVRNVALTAGEMPSGSNARPGDYVRLSMSDTGTGMAPEVAQRAIEPFYTTKDRASNSGLGLSSVAEFVRAAAGFLTIDSEVGHGTTVSIFLPRFTGDDPIKQNDTASTDVPLGDGELVLLIDDNERLLEATQALLEGLGYAVMAVGSGPEALALLAMGEPVDLVLSDIVMPGQMSGHDIARSIEALHGHIKVVLASGHFVEQNSVDEATIGKYTVLRKPYSRAVLARTLHAALAGSGQPADLAGKRIADAPDSLDQRRPLE